MSEILENVNDSEYLDSQYGITKDSVIACYAHYSGFAAVLLERVISCSNYVIEAKIDKRWTVTRLITGIASYVEIEKALKELKAVSGCTHSIIVNSEVDLAKVIKNVRLKFKPSESVEMATNNDVNASVFNLVARVNDRQIAFKKDVSSLIESVKFYNPSNLDVSLNALILAVNSIPANNFNYLLVS